MKDAILTMLIELSEKIEGPNSPFDRLQLTLNVGGMLVTGLLINHEQYMKQFLGGFIHEIWEKHGDKDEAKLKDAAEAAPEFIHLESARFFVPGQHPIPTTGAGVLWRGRLDAIVGFNIGELREGMPPAN